MPGMHLRTCIIRTRKRKDLHKRWRGLQVARESRLSGRLRQRGFERCQGATEEDLKMGLSGHFGGGILERFVRQFQFQS
jgi:hypothetical protein